MEIKTVSFFQKKNHTAVNEIEKGFESQSFTSKSFCTTSHSKPPRHPESNLTGPLPSSDILIVF